MLSTQPGARDLRLPESPRERPLVRRFRIGRCPVCGTTVRADDVLALIGAHVAHAECALVAHLGRRPLELGGGRGRERDGD